MLIKRRIRGILSGSTTVQWQRLWLILRLRSGLFSPGASSRRRWRWFPFHARVDLSPWSLPDCHLVRTAIPYLPSYDSLGDFHSRENRSLSLFCKHGFQKRCRHPLWPQRTAAWSSFPTCSLKAGYAARSNTILCTALQVLIPVRTRAGLREVLFVVAQDRVSTENGSYAPCHWSAPGILNPQHPP